jgi:putative lipoprotein
MMEQDPRMSGQVRGRTKAWPRFACAVGLVLAVSGALAQPAGLVGREWTVTELPRIGAVADRPPTFRLDADRRVTGFSGCNRFFGTYAADATSVTFSGLGMTRMACLGAGAAVEAAFTGAFRDRLTVAITADGTLVFTAADGAAIKAK